MTILFICNSFEEGKDGIGDYTKKISLECLEQGIYPIIVAINDKYTRNVHSGYIENLPFYRIPAYFSIRQKEKEIKKILSGIPEIDWISLQFVCYGLSENGLIGKYIGPLVRLFRNYKVHIMMHELWVGEELNANFKTRLWGKIQRFFILLFLKRMEPEVIQTSIPLYQKMLNNNGVGAGVLPIFSNIGLHAEISVEFRNKIPHQIIANREQYIIGCLFGSIYSNSWDMADLFKLLEAKGKVEKKKILITSIGKVGSGKIFWESLPLKYPNIEFLAFGARDEIFISNWLDTFVDFGIITTPAIIAGKSGSCMAFFEHGIPVFCRKNHLFFSFNVSEDLIDKRLIQVGDDLELAIPSRTSPTSHLKAVVKKFIENLNDF